MSTFHYPLSGSVADSLSGSLSMAVMILSMTRMWNTENSESHEDKAVDVWMLVISS